MFSFFFYYNWLVQAAVITSKVVSPFVLQDAELNSYKLSVYKIYLGLCISPLILLLRHIQLFEWMTIFIFVSSFLFFFLDKQWSFLSFFFLFVLMNSTLSNSLSVAPPILPHSQSVAGRALLGLPILFCQGTGSGVTVITVISWMFRHP